MRAPVAQLYNSMPLSSVPNDFTVTNSIGSSSSRPQFVVDGVDAFHRPQTAPTFLRRGSGGGGGNGGGRGGLGGKYAPRARADILPRTHHGVGSEAARYVASKPPQTKAPKAGALRQRTPDPTLFRAMYERGDLPLRVNGGVQKFVHWHVSGLSPSTTSNKTPPNFSSAGGPEYELARSSFLAALDYSVMLPLFFDGLREPSQPCQFLAHAGLKELLEADSADASRVGPIIPTLVLPIRQALNTRDPDTVRRTILAIQQLVRVRGVDASGQSCGELLGPYYRHILPVFNLFKSRESLNSGKTDYAQSLGELMDETMILMAERGAPEAQTEINRIVPLWVPPPKPPARRDVAPAQPARHPLTLRQT